LSVAVLTVVFCGIGAGSFKLLFGLSVSPFERLAGLLGSALAVSICVVPPFFFERVFSAQWRSHDLSTFHFPAVMRFCVAESSWGPKRLIRPFFVPLGFMAPPRANLFTLHLGQALLHSMISGLPSPSRMACGVSSGLHLLLSGVYALLVFRWQPYRSRVSRLGVVVTSVCLMIPSALRLAHAANLFALTSDDFDRGVLVCMLLHILRAAANVVSVVVEDFFVLPVVWPDDTAVMGQDLEDQLALDKDDSTKAEIARRSDDRRLGVSEVGGKITDDDVARALSPAPGLLSSNRAKPPLSKEDLEQWTYFDDADPDPAAAQKYAALRKLIAVKARETRVAWGESGRPQDPMLALAKGQGPMPPTLSQNKRREYDLL
jgi:hypothetical protein